MKSENASKNGQMKRKDYEKELRKLQVELCHLQEWVKEKGARVIILFEGRDAAGKGGTIKAMTERVSPRVFRVVALPAPSDRQKTPDVHAALHRALSRRRRDRDLRPQLVQPRRRRICHGLLHEEQHKRFLELCPQIENYIVDGGIRLIKIWLEVGKEEQEKRFQARIDDPLRQWKLSPMDLESYRRWYDYSRARDMMFEATDTQARALDHRALGRQAAGAPQLHLAYPDSIPYKKIERQKVKLPKRSNKASMTTGQLEGAELRSEAVLSLADRIVDLGEPIGWRSKSE